MNEIYDLMLEGLRVLFLIGVPVIAVAAFAGLFASLLQSFFAVQDGTIRYAFRLVGIVVVFSVLSASVVSSLENLIIQAMTR